jgi:hypothetical protein
MAIVKLRVDIANGVLEAEGDESFVRDMHAEFQSYVRQSATPATPARPQEAAVPVPAEAQEAEGGTNEQKGRRKPSRRRPKGPSPDNVQASKKASYEPRVLTEMNFSDLPGYLGGYSPKKGHKELIPLFAKYLETEKKITPFSADHLFTCYRFAKTKPPAAFTQTLYDARGKHHFLRFENFDAISLTHIGETYVEHDIPRKAPTE